MKKLKEINESYFWTPMFTICFFLMSDLRSQKHQGIDCRSQLCGHPKRSTLEVALSSAAATLRGGASNTKRTESSSLAMRRG